MYIDNTQIAAETDVNAVTTRLAMTAILASDLRYSASPTLIAYCYANFQTIKLMPNT